MKTKYILFSIVAFLFFGAATVSANAQTAPQFKISAIKIVPYDELTGEFGEEYKPKDDRSFFDDVSEGLWVTVEISGKTDASAEGLKLEVSVLKGGKPLSKKLVNVFGVGSGGKYFSPLYIDAGQCLEISITAKLIGQKTPSTMTRKVPFACGE